MAGLTLDTGALIAAEKNERRFWTYWKEALRRDVEMTLPATVLAQAWRGNHPRMARVINACALESFDEPRARVVGTLLAAAGTSDIVDATVVLGAIARDDAVITSDLADLQRLAGAAGREIEILPI